MGFGLNGLAFWSCTSGDLDTRDAEGVYLKLLPQRPEMLLYVPSVAWSDLNPLPEIVGAVPALGSPESGWGLGSLPHHICPERCYLGQGATENISKAI